MITTNCATTRSWLTLLGWPLLAVTCFAPAGCGGESHRNAVEVRDLGTPCGDARRVDEGTVEVDAQSADCQGVCLSGDAVASPGTTSTGECSCRCDGPAGTGPFCACAAGYACQHEVDDLGLGEPGLAGSYCVAPR